MLVTLAPRPKMPSPTVEEMAKAIRAEMQRRLGR